MNRLLFRHVLRLAAWAVLLAAVPVHAQSADRIFPNGGQRGTTVTVTFPGMAAVDSAQLLVDGSGLKALGPFKKGVGQVEIASDAPPGRRQVRLIGPKSATAPRPFMVSALPVLLEKEPNNTIAQAQPIEHLPIVLNGTISRADDIDCFRVALKKGDFLVLDGESRRLAAPTNLAFHLRDAAGREVPSQLHYRKRDPVYTCVVPTDGDYRLQLSEVTSNNGGGSDDYAYWVTVTKGPWVDFAVPATVSRGKPSRVKLYGWNLDGKAGPGSAEVDVPVGADAGESIEVSAPGAPNSTSLRVGELPEVAETEPNDTPVQAQPLPIGTAVHGLFDRRGDLDRFRVEAKKGDVLLFEVEARELDSFADPVLTLEDAEGKRIDRVDDQNSSRDPRLVWKAPADGSYLVTLRDVAGGSRGGPEFFYRFSVRRMRPWLQLSAGEPNVVVKPGGTAEVALTVRQSYQPDELRISVENLPAGVTVTPLTVPATPDRDGSSQVRLRFAAAASASPGFAPIRIVATRNGVQETRFATWMITGDGGWGFGTGRTTQLVLVVPAP